MTPAETAFRELSACPNCPTCSELAQVALELIELENQTPNHEGAPE